MDGLLWGVLAVAAGEAALLWRVWMRAIAAEDERDELRAALLDRDEVTSRRAHSPAVPAYR